MPDPEIARVRARLKRLAEMRKAAAAARDYVREDRIRLRSEIAKDQLRKLGYPEDAP